MAKLGRPAVYQSVAEKPVTVSLRLPRDVYEQAQRYVKMRHPMTLTDLLLDGLRLRLDTPADPRDIILSDDNTVIQELQEMIQTAVQAEIGKLSNFMGRQFITPAVIPTPEASAEPVPELSLDDNTVLHQGGEQVQEDPESPSIHDAAVGSPPVRRPGRKSTLRQPILDLLRAHPDGLTAVEIKVHLDVHKNIGDTLSGMVRNHLIEKQGSGAQVRYRAVGAHQVLPAASRATATPAPARRTTRTAQRA